ncbi:protease complex subunit PrcB family protein [Winogradskyella aurantiaca]|uniref:protease complex subunit PrcB family protein n=1 Tax=Winogradskyella aurantiaca TaxID=2219558 RepID=UPI000E1E0DBB|nr:protease complex subunit PrcB family protein [Winogradskyella aurantiaca]
MKYLIFVLVLTFSVLSCNNTVQSSQEPVTTTLISKGELYGNGAEGILSSQRVINDTSAWNSLLDQMNSVNTVSDSFSEIDINFSEFTVIAVFDDIKGNGGYGIDLAVSSTNETIIVDVTHLSPEGNAITVMTQPYHIIKIPKALLPVVFN